jgi:DNA-binding NtrC family response regulator
MSRAVRFISLGDLQVAFVRILIVDDDPGVGDILSSYFLETGSFEPVVVGSGVEAIEEFERNEFELVLLDLYMPGMDGLEVLRQLKGLNPGCEVIMMTAFGSVPTAAKALDLGAYAYVSKPFDFPDLSRLISRARELVELRQAYRLLAHERLRNYHINNLIAVSPIMQAVRDQVVGLCQNVEPILVTGEAGTGKRFLSRIIHFNGRVRESLVMQLNVSEIEEWVTLGRLLHSSGVIMDAEELPNDLYRQGYGTLILNRLNELDPPVQIALGNLLRARDPELQARGDMPGLRVIGLVEVPDEKVNPEQVIEPALLEYFTNRINMPPLRERQECILPVAQLFFQRHVSEIGGRGFYISRPVQEFLTLYSWPGNLRELEYMINRLTVICTSRLVSAHDLQQVHRELQENRQIQDRSLEELLTLAEKQLLQTTFARPKAEPNVDTSKAT